MKIFKRNELNILGTGNLHFEMEWNIDDVIARQKYTMVLSPPEMALPTKDSPHVASPHNP